MSIPESGTAKSIAYRHSTRSPETGECWVWQRAVAPVKGDYPNDGYPIMKWQGKLRRVQRVLLAEKLGLADLAPDVLAANACGCKRCVNPDHLYAGQSAKTAVAPHGSQAKLLPLSPPGQDGAA